MAAHVTALTIARLNSSILEAFGKNQPTVVRNQVNVPSKFFTCEDPFQYNNIMISVLLKTFNIQKRTFPECKKNADCNIASNPDKKICQAGRCIRNINILNKMIKVLLLK